MSQRTDTTRAASLLMQHYARLYGFVYACLGSHADTEDVLQEVGVVVTEKLNQLESDDGLLPWAREIARREVLAFYRRSTRQPALLEPEAVEVLADAAERLERRTVWPDRHEALTQCLDELPPHSRELIRLRYDDSVDGVESLAARVGRTLSATYGLLKRIRISLRTCIERKLAEGGSR